MKSKYRNIFLIFGIVAIVVMLCTFDMEYDELLANLRRAGIWLPAVVGLWIIITCSIPFLGTLLSEMEKKERLFHFGKFISLQFPGLH